MSFWIYMDSAKTSRSLPLEFVFKTSNKESKMVKSTLTKVTKSITFTRFPAVLENIVSKHLCLKVPFKHYLQETTMITIHCLMKGYFW